MAASLVKDSFAMISNIPFSFHSQDLRNYFSQFVEEKRFKCFHFRNRPEYRLSRCPSKASSIDHRTISDNDVNVSNVTNLNVIGSGTSHRIGPTDVLARPNVPSATTSPPRKCCIIKLSRKNFQKLVHLYNKKPWIDQNGDAMRLRCNIVSVNIKNSSNSEDAGVHGNRAGSISFSEDDVNSLPELNPPDIMPRGNVGTPTQTFLELIKDCKIPPSVIRKLGLTFPKRRSNRQYGNVPFHYGTNVTPGREEEEVALTGKGEEIIDVVVNTSLNVKKNVQGTESQETSSHHQIREESPERNVQSESDDDDDTCEEWERYEALHDDVTKQDRTEERLFEEEMEIVWDKGSSGLVFYTDAAYWDAEKGDFDERTSDDWDVDMSIFYENGSGTKDAKDWLQMQKEMRLRRGEEDTSVFTKNQIGKFEKHTKGFGRTVMNKMGWQDGDGLGKTSSGMKDALDNEGQTSKDKRGLGYHGEKLDRYPGVKRQKSSPIISTIFDDKEQTEESTTLLRRSKPSALKYR
ncbi:G patch domain-containing protein 3 [Holothuria leucospilota]|uniref:G patch domain-containing protein 3 n=1 Tax=Holothuria leucospilota TaxID=206669 RepID=A0A9Q1CFJ1_HOLLE|nr:G patch domain-containing protein 3 [Holothuria leucospilota]